MRHRIALCIAALCAAAAGTAWAARLAVAPGEPIAAAVAQAQPGDVIELAAGTYAPVRLDVPGVTLRGVEGTVIDARGRGSGITVKGVDIKVESLAVVNYGKDLYKRDSGILITQGSSRAVVRDVELKGPGFGVRADDCEGVEIRRVKITGEKRRPVLDRGDGVYLRYVRKPELHDNRVIHARDGFYFENVTASRSSGNYFAGCQYGIHYMYTRGDKAWSNRAEHDIGGYALMSSRDIELRESTARACVEFGVLLNVCDRCSVDRVAVKRTRNPRGRAALNTEGKGLFIYGPGYCRVTRSSFSESDIGVSVALGGGQGVFAGNALWDNLVQCRYVGEDSLEWSENGRGNFWGSHLGWDTDGDGVAERPYQPNDSLDRLFWIYPEARFLMDSPAVALLRWLAAQFEIDRGKGVTDSHPLMKAPEDAATFKEPA
ncbi:MAG: nitrous oxide reductase family maturation protein NosD [Duodenibacillus sp.]|nr:nitrous oxide reductase family maturation protein NosD [Duodenibacillus sp.]